MGHLLFRRRHPKKKGNSGKAYSLRSIPNKEKQQERLRESINKSVREFNNYISDNPHLSEEQTCELENLILNNSGASSQSRSDRYIRFELKGAHFEPQPVIPVEQGLWEVKPVSQLYEDSDRATVNVQNVEIGVKIKFVFNFKNNEKVEGLPEKADAKLGLGSPSWNVWISNINEVR